MATLETQYKNYLAKHPDSTFSFSNWKEYHGNMIGEAFERMENEKKEKVSVEIIECERGWGQKIDEVVEFDTMELAQDFIKRYNSKNNESVTPDWYMYAILK